MPPGFSPAALCVQTAIATQVNLIVEGAGGPLQFWNGAQVTPNDTVNGGTGTWDAATTNWTNQNGSATAPWDSGFAVFTGAAGTVTVAGAQAFTGLQFITDRYQLVARTGGALMPVGTALVRVDPGVTAEIRRADHGHGRHQQGRRGHARPLRKQQLQRRDDFVGRHTASVLRRQSRRGRGRARPSTAAHCG